jgi:peptidoglycan/xylan/chitin deacetylase (PgdA/CDA1 family)
VNGKNYGDLNNEEDAAKIRRAYYAGHQIASHTYSHADLDTLGPDGIRSEMEQLDAQLQRIIGRRPVYMRPPYGNVNAQTEAVLTGLGYQIVKWNLDTNDWRHPYDVEASLQEYIQALDDAEGDPSAAFISLQHDTIRLTAIELVERAVRLVRARGYQLMRIDECLGRPGSAYR